MKVQLFPSNQGRVSYFVPLPISLVRDMKLRKGSTLEWSFNQGDCSVRIIKVDDE